MKYKLLLAMFLGLFLIGNVFALDTIGTFKKNETINFCQICYDATYISISIKYPNSTIALLNDNLTSFGNGLFCDYFNLTENNGRYNVLGISDGCDKTFVTYFYINPTGIESSDANNSIVSLAIWFLFIIAIILFMGFLFVPSKPPVKWTFFLISMMFLLQAITILYTGMQNEVVGTNIENYFSFLASASFILFWFAMGLLVVLWILTSLQTLLLNKKQKQQEKYQ